MELADRIVVMQAGRVEQVAPPGSLYTNPQTLTVAQFIGAMNTCTTTLRQGCASWYGLPLTLHQSEGEAALLCRPEDLFPDPQGVAAQVLRVIDLGPVTKVTLLTPNGDLLTWTCPREAAPATGAQVRLLPRRLHIFRGAALLARLERPEPALQGVPA